jgi:hypothetical protein
MHVMPVWLPIGCPDVVVGAGQIAAQGSSGCITGACLVLAIRSLLHLFEQQYGPVSAVLTAHLDGIAVQGPEHKNLLSLHALGCGMTGGQFGYHSLIKGHGMAPFCIGIRFW